MMQLVEINPKDVQKECPSFYHAQSRSFAINTDGNEVGIYGVKFLEKRICEISLFIFEDYRYKIPYRKILKVLLSYPFGLGYDSILISSSKRSIITLLNECKSLGVRCLGYLNEKIWFVVERSFA